MNRHLHDIMSAQFKTCEAYGTDFLSWDNGVRCFIPEIETSATDGKIICTGRNLATPTSTVVQSSEDGASWKYSALGRYPLAPGDYSISVKYRQLGEITRVSLSMRDYDSKVTELSTITSTNESGTLFRSFTIPVGTRGCYIYLYSNCTANELFSKCEFYDIMFVRGAYTESTMPEFEEFFSGGSVGLPASDNIKLAQPNGYGQVFIGGSTTSGNNINLKYITHS